MSSFTIVQEGHEYNVSVRHNGDVLDITTTGYDGSEILVADAEFDSGAEQVFVTYYGSDEKFDVDVPSELYWKHDLRLLAKWIINGLYTE